ncbi:hypothetical protein CSIRO_4012 [Bradyrhizobiaceae bacterium SG-6C]|nr:hypothetical protein CSIRO_4012 [Bradyrhizobiaceae bacterium SG-6C]
MTGRTVAFWPSPAGRQSRVGIRVKGHVAAAELSFANAACCGRCVSF